MPTHPPFSVTARSSRMLGVPADVGLCEMMWYSIRLIAHPELCSGDQVDLKVGLVDPQCVTIRSLENTINVN